MAQTDQQNTNDTSTTKATQKLAGTKPAPEAPPTFAARVGTWIPEWATPALAAGEKVLSDPLAAGEKYLVDPFNKMAATGAKVGGEVVSDTTAAMAEHPVETLVSVGRGELGLPPTATETKDIGGAPEQFASQHPVASGVAQGIGEMAGGIAADPRMWPFGFGELGGAAVKRLVSLGFSLQTLYGAAQSLPKIREALATGNAHEAARLLTEAGVGTVAGTLAGTSAVHGIDFSDIGGKVVGKITETGQKVTAPLASRPAFRGMNPEAGRIDFSPLGGKEVGKLSTPAEETALQGGHAGGGVASVEELNRPGRFIKVGRGGDVTDRGKTPDFMKDLRPGEAGFQVMPDGSYRQVAGAGETPAMQKGIAGYIQETIHKKTTPQPATEENVAENPQVHDLGDLTEPAPEKTSAPKKIVTASGRRATVPPEKTTGEFDDVIKQGGGIPGGRYKLGEGNDLVQFHDPESGTSLVLPEKEVTPENVAKQLEKSRAVYDKARREAISNSANAFSQKRGANGRLNHAPVTVNPVEAANVADAYDELVHDPNDPAVKKSYDALISEVEQQWNHAQKDLKIEFEPVGENPYPDAQAMLDDIYKNRHLSIWTGGEPPADHPLSAVNPRTGLSNNVMFRGVHDVFGHATGGHDFSQNGKESAFRAHQQMFSPEALPAMTTETKGQASWFYNNRGVRQGEPLGKFPQQKAALLPSEYHTPTMSDRLVSKYGTTENPLQAGFILADGRMVPLHTEHDIMLNSANGTVGGIGPSMREGFIQSEGAIRTRVRRTPRGDEVVFSVPEKGVTSQQVRQIQSSVAAIGPRANVVLETVGAQPRSAELSLFKSGQPVRAADVTGALKKLGVAPTPEWADKVAQDSSTQSAGAVNPRTGKADGEGFGVEMIPERRVKLDHPATAKDFEDFYEKNKDVLDKYPKLRIGWDQNGRELNLGAATKNRAVAEWLGRKLGQRAIWDMAKGQEIPTGGAGEKAKFNYPLEQRFKDLTGEGFRPFQKNFPTRNELVAAIGAAKSYSDWWAQSRDAVNALVGGDEEQADDLGQFLAALSSNKPNEEGLLNALVLYKDWRNAGYPNEPGAVSQLFDKAFKEGRLGASITGRTDQALLERHVTGQGSLYNPVSPRNSKIAQMGLAMRGDAGAAVLDRYIARAMTGGDKLEGKLYFAAKDALADAADHAGMTMEQAQAALWTMMRAAAENPTSQALLDKLKKGDILKAGESYADIARTNPKVRDAVSELAEALGLHPDRIQERLQAIAERGAGTDKGTKDRVSSRFLASFARKVTGEQSRSVPKAVTPRFYRAETGYQHARGTTAGDVLRHEQEELGNTLNVPAAKISELDRYPASALHWVTKQPEHARRYGVPAEKTFHRPEIIARDKDKGFLVLEKAPSTKAEKIASKRLAGNK